MQETLQNLGPGGVEGILGGVVNAVIPRGPPVAKAFNQNGSDSEERKPGEQTGLDTRVVLAVNAASKVLHILQEYAVSKRRC